MVPLTPGAYASFMTIWGGIHDLRAALYRGVDKATMSSALGMDTADVPPDSERDALMALRLFMVGVPSDN